MLTFFFNIIKTQKQKYVKELEELINLFIFVRIVSRR